MIARRLLLALPVLGAAAASTQSDTHTSKLTVVPLAKASALTLTTTIIDVVKISVIETQADKITETSTKTVTRLATPFSSSAPSCTLSTTDGACSPAASSQTSVTIVLTVRPSTAPSFSWWQTSDDSLATFFLPPWPTSTATTSTGAVTVVVVSSGPTATLMSHQVS